MSKLEMEKKIKELEDRIATLEARPVFIPQPYPIPAYPYWQGPWWGTDPLPRYPQFKITYTTSSGTAQLGSYDSKVT